MKIHYLLFYYFIGLAFFGNAQTSINLKNEINEALKQEGLTGAVWSVVDSSGSILIDAVGVSNNEKGTILRPTNKVHIGSITKTLLAIGVLKLATENQLDLNDSVSKFLPKLTFDNQWSGNKPVTIRHLLDHTSGMSDLRLWQIFSKNAKPNSLLEIAFKHDPKVMKIHTKPGSVFSYSNMGYTLLAMIVESITNERYECYFDKALLKPLGMLNSTFEFVSQNREQSEKDLAFGHLDNKTISSALPIFLRPAGQFTTTAYDMAIFLKFLLSDGKINGKKFIDQNYLLQMGKSQNSIAKQKGLEIGYGLGAMTRDRHGLIGLAHSGNIVGYHSMLYWFPKFKKAFFISHNMDSETANYERFNKIMINYLNVDSVFKVPKPLKTKGLEDWAGYYLPVFSKVEPFAYADILGGFTKIGISENEVSINPFQKPKKILYRVNENTLIAQDKIQNSHVFYKDLKNDFFISDSFSTLKKVNSYFLLGHWTSFILGCISILYLFLLSSYQFLVYKRRMLFDPLFSTFIGIVIILLPFPFFFLQPFFVLGDKTFASVLFFLATCYFPLGIAFSLVRFSKNKQTILNNKLKIIALLFALQWIVTLFIWDLVPFKIWI